MKNLILNKQALNNLFSKDIFLKICLIISSANVVIWFIKKYIFGDREPFWDLVINYCAGQSYINGISPYNYGVGINPLGKCLNESGGLNDAFVYVATIPLLKISSLLAQFDIETIKSFWVIINLFSFFIIFLTSTYIYKINKKYSWYILMLLFSFGGVGFFSFLTGNITTLAATFISIGIYFYLKKNINIFCLCICIAALVRPQLFLFILLPFMEENKKYFLNVIFYSFTIAILFFYDFIFQKELFFGFLKGLAYVRSDAWFFTFGDGIGLDAIIDQLSYAVLLLFDVYIQPGPSKYSNILWIILSSIILLSTYFFLTKKNISKKINKTNSIALGIVIITLCLPRLQMYDLILAIPAVHCIAINIMSEKQKRLSFLGFAMLSIMYAVHDLNSPLFLFSLIFFYYTLIQFTNNFRKA